jgi:hypothetical protein
VRGVGLIWIFAWLDESLEMQLYSEGLSDSSALMKVLPEPGVPAAPIFVSMKVSLPGTHKPC